MINLQGTNSYFFVIYKTKYNISQRWIYETGYFSITTVEKSLYKDGLLTLEFCLMNQGSDTFKELLESRYPKCTSLCVTLTKMRGYFNFSVKNPTTLQRQVFSDGKQILSN